MGNKVEKRFRKEFQIKLREDLVEKKDNVAHANLILSALRDIESSGKFNFKVLNPGKGETPTFWERHGERYDVREKDESGKEGDKCFFKSRRISLATEKRLNKKNKPRTKMKCKLHNFVPELLYKEPEKALCWPSSGPFPKGEVDRRFKLEQDIHFTNCKYCCTGYPTVKEHPVFENVGQFLLYYPNLAKLPGLKADDPLVLVKDWDEAIFNDLEMEVGGEKIGGALVIRRYRGTPGTMPSDKHEGDLDESEFSFKLDATKLKKLDPLEPVTAWKRKVLVSLQQVYDELYRKFAGEKDETKNLMLMKEPGGFCYIEPVSSKCDDRCPSPKGGAAKKKTVQ